MKKVEEGKGTRQENEKKRGIRRKGQGRR